MWGRSSLGFSGNRGALPTKLGVATDELVAVRTGPLASGRFEADARARAAARMTELTDQHRIETMPDMLTRLVDGWLDRIESELGGIATDAPFDARMIGGLVTRASKA